MVCQIAYSRAEAGLGPDEPYSAPRIWIIDLATGDAARLFADTQKLGYGPYWSPDGSMLAYADGVNNQIVVIELEGGREITLPNQLGNAGSWSPDSQTILYADILPEGPGFYEVIYQVNLSTEDSTILYGSLPNDNQFNNPQWSPDGEWIALSTWPKGSASNRELMIMSAGDLFGTVIANNPTFLYNNYSFDPSANLLLYQQLELGRTDTQPEVLVFDISSGKSRVVVQNASFPAWLP